MYTHPGREWGQGEGSIHVALEFMNYRDFKYVLFSHLVPVSTPMTKVDLVPANVNSDYIKVIKKF